MYLFVLVGGFALSLDSSYNPLLPTTTPIFDIIITICSFIHRSVNNSYVLKGKKKPRFVGKSVVKQASSVRRRTAQWSLLKEAFLGVNNRLQIIYRYDVAWKFFHTSVED